MISSMSTSHARGIIKQSTGTAAATLKVLGLKKVIFVALNDTYHTSHFVNLDSLLVEERRIEDGIPFVQPLA